MKEVNIERDVIDEFRDIWEKCLVEDIHMGARASLEAFLRSIVSRIQDGSERKGRLDVVNYIEDEINDYVGSPNNPDYSMPDGEKIMEILDEARNL